jgi:hypothetical protein
MKKAEPIGDELCKYCPLDKDKQGVYSTPGGYSVGCEGNHCTEAKQNYDDQIIQETESVPLTAEEIIRRHLTTNDLIHVSLKEIIKCMHEYASQFQPKEIDLKKELKDFNSWMCGKQYDGLVPMIDTCIDEYLNSK